MSDRRNELSRVLAAIDRLLAEVEAIAEDPQDDDRGRALEFLIELRQRRRDVETALAAEKSSEN
jgi:hypothetical protein